VQTSTFFKRFIYLFERARERETVWGGGGAERGGDKQAQSQDLEIMT